jgi:hypothetical protein
MSRSLSTQAAIATLSFANAVFVCSTSMAGISLLISSTPITMIGGLLACLIDIDVNRITLKDGIKKLMTDEYLLLRLSRQKLLNHLNEFSPAEEAHLNDFLKYYRDLYQHYSVLKKLDAPQHKLEPLRKELHDLERYYAYYLLALSDKNSKKTNYAKSFFLLDNYHTKKEAIAFKDEFHHKQQQVRLSSSLCLPAGIGTALITLYAMHITLPSIMVFFGGSALIASSSMAGIFIIAILAGFWYALTTYNNLHSMIVTESIYQKYLEIKSFLHKQDANRPISLLIKKIAVLLGLAIVLSLGLFMTLATFGTWWYGVKHATRLLPLLRNIAHFIVATVVPAVALAVFLFNFNNFLESIWKCYAGLKKLIKKIKLYFKLNPNTSWAERLNPFRFLHVILFIPCKLAFLLGHVISVGAIADRMPNVPPAVPMVAGAVCEAGEDGHFVMKNKGILHLITTLILFPLSVLDAFWRFSFCTPSNERSFTRFKQILLACNGFEKKQLPERVISTNERFNNQWDTARLSLPVHRYIKSNHEHLLSSCARTKAQNLKEYLSNPYKTNEEKLRAQLNIHRFFKLKAKNNTKGYEVFCSYLRELPQAS